MKVALNFAIALAAIFLVSNSLAHNGHDHDAPTTLKAPKGGIIKALDEARVEVVSKGRDIKVYVYNQELQPAPASQFKIVASVELPRSKKTEALVLKAKETHFEGGYDAKGLHRYTLKLSVTDAKTTRTDMLSFTIEPRK